MTIEVTILISVVSVPAAIFFGIKSSHRADKQDIDQQKKEAATSIQVASDCILTQNGGKENGLQSC